MNPSAKQSPERAMLAMEREPQTNFELCYFAEPGSIIRLRGDRGIYQVMRQITFRCGMCAQPVAEGGMNKHTRDHEMNQNLVAHESRG